jgi:hypothetical protein
MPSGKAPGSSGWTVLLDASRVPAETLPAWVNAGPQCEVDGLVVPTGATRAGTRLAVFAAVEPVGDLPAADGLAGYLVGPGVALDATRVRALSRAEGRVLLTANALSRSDLDLYAGWFPSERLVLVYRHGAPEPVERDVLRTMLALMKLQRLGTVPVALAASPRHLDVATLALAWGATAVLWEVAVAAGVAAPTVAQVKTATAELRRAEAFLESAELVDMDAEDWDAIESEAASLVAARAIHRGETLTADMVRAEPPYRGVSPSLLPRILGSRLRYDMAEGESVTFGMLDVAPRRSA